MKEINLSFMMSATRAVYMHMHLNNHLKKKYLKISSFLLLKLGGVNER